MKTAFTIERQESRKKDEKEAQAPGSDGRLSSQFSPPVTRVGKGSKTKASDGDRLKPWQWQKGVSGNPGGVPKVDVAAELARAIIEGNQELIYKAFVKALSKGNAYCLQVLADRGYGKLKESRVIEHAPYQDVSTQDLEAHIQELEAKLIASLVERGYTITKPPQLLPPGDDDPKVQ
jgi:hypothetical protein